MKKLAIYLTLAAFAGITSIQAGEGKQCATQAKAESKCCASKSELTKKNGAKKSVAQRNGTAKGAHGG